jgi:hypothetical protein
MPVVLKHKLDPLKPDLFFSRVGERYVLLEYFGDKDFFTKWYAKNYKWEEGHAMLEYRALKIPLKCPYHECGKPLRVVTFFEDFVRNINSENIKSLFIEYDCDVGHQDIWEHKVLNRRRVMALPAGEVLDQVHTLRNDLTS